MHDPIGLAGKALFFKMVSESLTDPKSDFSTETAIYQSYIESCLTARGKAELLEGNYRHTAEADIRAGVSSRLWNVSPSRFMYPQGITFV